MRTKFLIHMMLVFIWLALTGDFSWANFIFGFIISFVGLWQVNRNEKQKRYFKVIPQVLSFIFYFIYELTKANLQVAYEVISPPLNMKPGIVKLPLDVKTDLEITLLANVISLTPGTLSLDVSPDKRFLYVHAMYVYDKEEFIRSIKDGFERRILQIVK